MDVFSGSMKLIEAVFTSIPVITTLPGFTECLVYYSVSKQGEKGFIFIEEKISDQIL